MLVVGGQAPKAIRSVECYDFKEERWYQVAEMPSRRCRYEHDYYIRPQFLAIVIMRIKNWIDFSKRLTLMDILNIVEAVFGRRKMRSMGQFKVLSAFSKLLLTSYLNY